MMSNVLHNFRLMLGSEASKKDQLDEKYEKLVATIDEQNVSIQKLMTLLTEDRNAINSLIEVSSFVKEQQEEIVKYIIFSDEIKSVQSEKDNDDFVN
jgi:hypothetical protein